MRGKEMFHRRFFPPERITPAYAGKSPHVRDWRTTKKDHPRLCGEKCLQLYAAGVFLGSPPPMRGKVSTELLQKFAD